MDQHYNSQTIDHFSPKHRVKTLHRSSSASKHNIFQNAKTPVKHQKLRSTSVKSLMGTQNFNNTHQKVTKKQLDFVIPNKSNQKEGSMINEKKTVEDIMNRLKNKKQTRLKITKEIKIDQKEDKLSKVLSNIQPQLNFYHLNELSKEEIVINDHKKTEISQKNQKKSAQKQQEGTSRLQQMEKQKEKQMETRMKQMLEEKSKSLIETQTQVNNKLQLIESMMNSFHKTVKTKEQELQEKQNFLKLKEQQIETKIKETAQTIIQEQLSKNVLVPQNLSFKTSIQNQTVEKISLESELKTISPKNSTFSGQSKNLYQSPTNHQNSGNQTEQRFNYQTIESQNSENKKLAIQQEDSETDGKKTAYFKRYDTSDLVDLDQIQSISFKAPENNPKTKREDVFTQKIEEKRPSSSRRTIKTVKQPASIPPNIQESHTSQNNTLKDKQSVQILNMSQQEIPKKAIQSDITRKQIPLQNQIPKPPSIKQAQRSFNQSFEKQKQKTKRQHETSKEMSRKHSMTSSVSERSEAEETKQKKREEKERTAQIVKMISRINELVYFIGEIPHHCSSQMKKKKKYQFKLASLYLLKYVFDKFRYLTKICHDLLKKKVITKEYLQEREQENSRIKESYQKMKSYVYKKEPFPPKQCQKYLDENSDSLCMDDPHFIKGLLFREIKEIITFYYEDTKGKWTDHQVNLCYYRMFLAVFILEEIEFENIVLETQETEHPDYMLGEIEKFTQDELKDKMTECYEIFVDLDFN